MKGLKQFGAMAMAAALTITMVAPITANAEVTWTREKKGDGEYSYNYTFTNEDTKDTATIEGLDKDGENAYGDNVQYWVMEALESETKAYTICVNSYDEYVSLNTTKDVAKFSNFKSNKKDLKVKVIKTKESSYPDLAKESVGPDYYDKDGNGYYKNVDGKIIKVDKAKLDTDMPKGYDSARYTVRLYAKKAGTYKLKFDAVMKNGNTVKKTIKVIAKDYGNAIKSVTFAGKVVYQTKDDNGVDPNSLWTKGAGQNVTTAKSGKIRVTMSSKDFKLKKIEVGTPNIETKTDTDGEVSVDFKEATSSLDQNCTWKKVKNGKKIKLAKVDTSAVGQSYYPKHTKFSYKDTQTTTLIRITYYDKKNKTTERRTFAINRIQK